MRLVVKVAPYYTSVTRMSDFQPLRSGIANVMSLVIRIYRDSAFFLFSHLLVGAHTSSSAVHTNNAML
jgi:hypothetical protein